MTDKRLAEIEARHKHAKESHIIFVGRDLFPEDPTQQALADFINFQSHALDDIPWLISEVREQAAEIERLQMKLDDYFCSVCQKPKRECPGWHMDGATKVYHSYGDYCD